MSPAVEAIFSYTGPIQNAVAFVSYDSTADSWVAVGVDASDGARLNEPATFDDPWAAIQSARQLVGLHFEPADCSKCDRRVMLDPDRAPICSRCRRETERECGPGAPICNLCDRFCEAYASLRRAPRSI